jgi:hypothetical protein
MENFLYRTLPESACKEWKISLYLKERGYSGNTGFLAGYPKLQRKQER